METISLKARVMRIESNKKLAALTQLNQVHVKYYYYYCICMYYLTLYNFCPDICIAFLLVIYVLLS
jgi:hypothetical protein